VGSKTGTAEDVRKTMEVASGGVTAPVAVTRFAFAGGWHWMMSFYDEERESWVSTSRVPGVEDKTNDVFLEFLVKQSGKYSQLVEQGKAINAGSFLKTIDGIEYNFTKWEMMTPDSLLVEIWEGEPNR